MSSFVEVIDPRGERKVSDRWVLYLERKQNGEAIFSRRGPYSSTRTFGSLDDARGYISQQRLEADPLLRCIRIYRLPL